MRFLVTGCAGFIGAEVVRQIVEDRNYALPWGLDLGTAAAVNWDRVDDWIGFRLIQGDVADPAAVSAIIERSKPDAVLHLAAQSHVDASLRDPRSTMVTNAVGTQVVAEACASAGIPMVYCSTDEVYGDAYEDGAYLRPRNEQDALAPSSPYSAGKAAGELAVRAAARSLGLRYAITRGCNAFGPNQTSDKLIPIACELLQDGKSVPLHGGGSQVRQWIHVSEFAKMLIEVAEALVNGSIENETYNLAGPRSCSVLDLVCVLAKVCERSDDFVHSVADRPGQDRAYCITGDKMQQDLGIVAVRDLMSLREIGEVLDCYRGAGKAEPALYELPQGGQNARL